MANYSSMKLVVALTVLAATSALVKSDETNTSHHQQQQSNASSTNVTSPSNPGAQLGPDCLLLNIRFAHNDMIPKEMQPTLPDCDKECQCYNGKILCRPICEPISQVPPANMSCDPEFAFRIQDECCLKWICPPTEDYALQNFSVKPLNATAVEVIFVLPMFAVGREGKAELNYTGVPLSDPASQGELPPANAIWLRRQNIRTANGVFPRQSIKYYMQPLKPNYRYWFKLGVIFAEQSPPFDEVLESTIETATTYPLSPTTSIPISTTSATTTTLSTSTLGPLLQTLAPATSSTTSTTISPPTTTSTTPTSTSTTPPSQTLAPATTQTPTTSSTTPATTIASQTMQTLAPVTSTTTTTMSTLPQTTTTPPNSPSTTATTTTVSPPTIQILGADIIKQSPSDVAYDTSKQHKLPPCTLSNNINNQNNNEIDQQASLGMSLPWVQQVNIPLQNYASGLLLALVCVSLLLLITTFKLCKQSSYGHMAPQAYDNPSFTKLVSFYAQQPNDLLVDENNQNYSNNVILAEQKNFEADKLSPLHRS